MKKIAFVIPWYGEDISGGAETALRGLVHHLQDADVELEVLTTCVKDFRSDWSIDFHPAGESTCAGISVRRFPARPRDTGTFDRINAKFVENRPVTKEEERIYQREMVNSPQLYSYIRENQSQYGLFVFTPYMFGTTYYGIQECQEKAVMIPCLHDEAYAHMKLFQEAFPKVAGMIFLTETERQLAQSLYGVSGEGFTALGTGVDTDFRGNAQPFRDKYRINDPFILYAGRKAAGKRVDELIRHFIRYKERNPSGLKLVLIGGGEIDTPSADIVDLGFVPAQDKYDAYAAASVFCNPSQFESFSLVIMESWLAQVPVLVNGRCAVTSDFARKTNGGLYYSSYYEFEGCLNYLFANPAVSRQMGRSGREFVLENFSWDAITKKYIAYFEKLESRVEHNEG